LVGLRWVQGGLVEGNLKRTTHSRGWDSNFFAKAISS
jgi:hypothetical protein